MSNTRKLQRHLVTSEKNKKRQNEDYNLYGLKKTNMAVYQNSTTRHVCSNQHQLHPKKTSGLNSYNQIIRVRGIISN